MNITLIGGVVVPLFVEYIVARKPRNSPGRKRKRGKRGRAQNRGLYPVLRLLGIAERLSPLVRSLVAQRGTLAISFEAARDTLAQMGIAMSTKRVARITYAFHQIALRQRRHQVEQARRGTLPTGTLLAGQRVVIAVDGGRTRLRRPKRGRRRKGRRHHGYHAEWKEPKLLTIYVVDERGRKIRTVRIPVTNDGTFEGVEAFMALLKMHLVHLGVCHAHSVLLIGDGAPWIWLRIPPLLRQLGCPEEIIFEALDFYHAAGCLNTFAQQAFPSTEAAQVWFKRQRRWLKQGRINVVLQNMQARLSQANGTPREEMETLYEFFVTHQPRMAYQQLAKHHLPIGSGTVESLIRQVVNLRLKGNGKFWLKQHAEGMLLARCRWAAGQWNQFRDLVLTDGLALALSN